MHAERIVGLCALLLSRPGLDARQISERLGVTERTVFRYLNTIRAGGFLVEFDRRTGGYVTRIDEERLIEKTGEPVDRTPTRAEAPAEPERVVNVADVLPAHVAAELPPPMERPREDTTSGDAGDRSDRHFPHRVPLDQWTRIPG